jgi:hypothetical protein
MVRAAAFTKSLALIHTQCVLFLFHFQDKKHRTPRDTALPNANSPN